MNQIRQISEFSIYTALAFIFGYIESLIPLPVPFPGMKIGLANLVMMIVLYRKNFRYAFGISMLRNLLNAITFGSLFSLLYRSLWPGSKRCAGHSRKVNISYLSAR